MTERVPRVMHVITTVDTGGAEMVLLRLLQRNDPERRRLSVVSLRPPGDLEDDYRQFAPVHSLDIETPLPSPAAFARLRGFFQQEQPDLVQAWMYHGNLAASVGALVARFRGPVLWNIRHSVHDMRYEKRSSRAVIRSNALLSRRPRAIIYNARRTMAQHEALGFAGDRSVFIPNGFDGTVFRPRHEEREKLRAELGVPLTAPLVGMFARYHPMKDPETLFRAFAKVRSRLPDARLVLAGRYSAEEERWASGVVHDLGLQASVRLIGRRADVPRLLSAFDVVASSSAWGEGFPNAIGEAMASGVPCVATDVGDSGAVMSRYGKLVPPRDANALAAALIEVLSLTREERQQLGQDARDHIMSNYELAAITDRYRILHDTFLDPSNRSAKPADIVGQLPWD